MFRRQCAKLLIAFPAMKLEQEKIFNIAMWAMWTQCLATFNRLDSFGCLVLLLRYQWLVSGMET